MADFEIKVSKTMVTNFGKPADYMSTSVKSNTAFTNMAMHLVNMQCFYDTMSKSMVAIL